MKRKKKKLARNQKILLNQNKQVIGALSDFYCFIIKTSEEIIHAQQDNAVFLKVNTFKTVHQHNTFESRNFVYNRN